ncbi:hypothetical protein MLD38_006635 [Melastoma candidum]|uniref:Uncharacterized protein n=1 Tax=Melastoma candidum TaxID=119954 RepID=A0ACB9RNI8_9MYRT|nr:hypothetical protein MLD38_006635 [Melastoma candidum]
MAPEIEDPVAHHLHRPFPRAFYVPPHARSRDRGRGRHLPRLRVLEMEVSEKDQGSEIGGGDEVANLDAYEEVPVESSGEDVPGPVGGFDEVELGVTVMENVRRCKYLKPTPVQRHAMPAVMAGRDLMACAQTGSGKTAAFCLPVIAKVAGDLESLGSRVFGRRKMVSPLALVLAPTRELACQIFEEARKFALGTGARVAVVYGGAPFGLQMRDLERGADILVATPGRLVDIVERGKATLTWIRYLTLDEADRMLDMGFEPQIRKIVQQMGMPPPGTRQTLLFSATFPEDIQRLASDFMLNYIFLTVGRVGSSAALIAQKVLFVEEFEKNTRLLDLIRSQEHNVSSGVKQLTLVFVETKRGADALETYLCSSGFAATAIHGDKVQHEREKALRSFRKRSIPIMVATDVASRGLDIPDVSHVINFDLPKSIDDYVHRIGRTGRAGKSGLATAFFNYKNTPLAKDLVNLMQEAKQEVPPWLTKCEKRASGGYGHPSHRGRVSNFGGRDIRRGAKPSPRDNNRPTIRIHVDGRSRPGDNHYTQPATAANFKDNGYDHSDSKDRPSFAAAGSWE